MGNGYDLNIDNYSKRLFEDNQYIEYYPPFFFILRFDGDIQLGARMPSVNTEIPS